MAVGISLTIGAPSAALAVLPTSAGSQARSGRRSVFRSFTINKDLLAQKCEPFEFGIPEVLALLFVHS